MRNRGIDCLVMKDLFSANIEFFLMDRMYSMKERANSVPKDFYLKY